jgi:hypothetical protein
MPRSRGWLPAVALATFVLGVGVVIAVSGDTFGYDFRAYFGAARRLVEGERLYDTSVEVMGPFGLFFYPPPFAVALVPFALLDLSLATWVWTGLLIASTVAAIWIMPVAPTIRWLILLIAGLNWPLTYAIKLGQVGPILLLLFALGWRWLERPAIAGASGALGALVKVQPGLVLGWALVARRWAIVAWGVVTVIVLSAASTLVTGVSAWGDFIAVLRQVSDPIATPHNFAPGAIAYQLGLSSDIGALVQLASTAAVLGVVVIGALRATPVGGYLVAVVASQLVSPVLWDHYALILLVPTAWLVARGILWAAVVPLLTPTVLAGIAPAIVYPFALWAALFAVCVLGIRDRRAQP